MKKVKLYGDTTKEQLKASAKDKAYNFILADGALRGSFIHSTRMVNEMRSNFGFGILETYILGHAYIACGLMTSNLKSNDRISMNIECSGPLKGLSVEANSFGEVRGYLKNVPIPLDKPLEKFNMSPFFGAGFLTITKNFKDLKQPYTGQTALQYGNIAEDLGHYFTASEQIPTLFNLSIKFDNEGEVVGAGGLFIQRMPGASDDITAEIEEIILKLESPGQLIADGKSTETIINESFAEYSPKILGNHRVEFFCRCNDDLMEGYLGMLPEADLKDMAENGPFPLELTCHNCNTKYSFTEDSIKKIYNKRLNLEKNGK